MNSSARRTLPTLLGAILTACASGDAVPAGFEITDSAGIVLVRNPVELVDTSRVPRLTPDLRLGVVDGAPEYQFARITRIVEGSGGEIYVVDREPLSVRVFDPAGQHVRTIGRSGPGPGELDNPVALRVTPGDTLHILDGSGFRGFRLHEFAPDGRFLETRTLVGAWGLVNDWAISDTGQITVQTSARPGPDGRRQQILLRGDFATQTMDTLQEIFPARPDQPVAHDAQPTWTFLSDGRLVIGRTDQYRFEYLRPDGTLERIVTRDLAARAITDAEKAAIVEARQQRPPLSTSPLAAQAMERIANAPVADSFPHYTGLMAGPRGTLWVRRFAVPAAAGGVQDGTFTWDVLDAEGLLLGSVRLQATYPDPFGGAEHIYQVVRDELQVPYVQRFRIDWRDGG
jgi:hypothetical protein